MFVAIFTNKHTTKLHHVGSLYILTYDARKLKHKIVRLVRNQLVIRPSAFVIFYSVATL